MIEVQKAKNEMTLNLNKIAEKETEKKRAQLIYKKRDQQIRHAIHAEEEKETTVQASHQIALKLKLSSRFRNPNKLPEINEMDNESLESFEELEILNLKIEKMTFEKEQENKKKAMLQTSVLTNTNALTGMIEGVEQDIMEIKKIKHQITGPMNGIKSERLYDMLRSSAGRIGSLKFGSMRPDLSKNDNLTLEKLDQEGVSYQENADNYLQSLNLEDLDNYSKFLRSDGIC
jgi:hypothetical protein